MKIGKLDIFNFILNGKVLGIELGEHKDDLIKKIGSPIYYEPQKKKNKGILNYGKLNIYIYDDTISSFSFNHFLSGYDLDLCKINLHEIIVFLNQNGISFDFKESNDKDELDFIFLKKYQLGFSDGLLCYFWAET
ncbi:hypothetical protein [Mannheimia haemolytica]|uniref:hypothetical protein n=1 Tax=Mannheimia haemolytica TaxID=75985 RepID=UPI001CF4395F|nr:hypothetical protein [Mannheimia haemolytica]MCB4226695.1 hypothetical protein [Mannheimia haemolytica]